MSNLKKNLQVDHLSDYLTFLTEHSLPVLFTHTVEIESIVYAFTIDRAGATAANINPMLTLASTASFVAFTKGILVLQFHAVS